MRGIALFLDGTDIKYIDESKVFDYARTENFEQIKEMISGYFFLFPAIFILFTAIYIAIQFKLNPRDAEEDEFKEIEKRLNRDDNKKIEEKVNKNFNGDGKVLSD